MGVNYNPHGIPILGYHGLYQDGESAGWGWTRMVDFVAQLKYLKAKDYTPITPSELVKEYLPTSRKNWKFAKPIVVTFDDGHSCIYNCFIKNKTIPAELTDEWFRATVYLIISKIGDSAETRYYAPEGAGYLIRNEIKDLVETGLFCFGSHSLTHQSLKGLLDRNLKDELTKETSESNLQLRSILTDLGVTRAQSNTFAYPFGNQHVSPAVVEYVKNAGYDCALDFDEKAYVNGKKTDTFRLRRISMTDSMNGWKASYNLLPKLKAALLRATVA